MTTIRHAKVSGAGPAADPSKVGGDDWDADHEVEGGMRLVDLGTVSVADVLDGPLSVLDEPDSYVLGIYGIGAVTPTDLGSVLLWPMTGTSPASADVADAVPVGRVTPSGLSGDPLSGSYPLRSAHIIAVLLDGTGTYPIIGSTWSADTEYADGQALIQNGTVWACSIAGTSGSVEPDWVANAGGSVADGTAEWSDINEAPPSTGSGHFVALIAELVTP